jgi:transcriptional regulator with XRE-family HTH domain
MQRVISVALRTAGTPMSMTIPTNVLRRAREQVDLKQNDVALRLGVSGSVISRLEKADATDETMARRYLEALRAPIGEEIAEFYSRPWALTERPSFFHPDREVLWACEHALQKLDQFTKGDDYDPLLDVPVEKIREGLKAAGSFVARLDHVMAWIGPVGVGKTTALSLLTNLVVEGRAGGRQPVFPATGGRTTISEVIIRSAPAYGIAVEPMAEDNVRLLVTDLVGGIAKNEGGVPTELERAIRNMADLRRTKDDKGLSVDPIRTMLAQRNNVVEDVVEEVIRLMNLSSRTETQMILSESTEKGLQWISENITKINYGQHLRFSLPDRVTVFVPPVVMRGMKFDVTIIDTKGIHGTTMRQDIRLQLDDPRALSILCCMFNDAPGGDTLKVLNELKALGSDALERQRVIILVLPRSDEAMKIIDESGDVPERVEDGYAIREMQIHDTLRKESLPEVPVVFFNAVNDPPAVAWERLSTQIDALRLRQVDRLHRFVEAAADLVTNADAAKIQQARSAIAEEVVRICESYAKLKPLIRPAHQTLIEELERGHPSSIAASVARRGDWYNFSVHHIIGLGVRVDANLRTQDVFTKIDGRLESLVQKFKTLREVVTILNALREDLEEWRQEFLTQAATIGRLAFKPYLDSASDFWSGLREYWGQGSGYRSRIVVSVREWFEQTEEVADARRRVENQLGGAWKELVLNRLLATTKVDQES